MFLLEWERFLKKRNYTKICLLHSYGFAGGQIFFYLNFTLIQKVTIFWSYLTNDETDATNNVSTHFYLTDSLYVSFALTEEMKSWWTDITEGKYI